MFSIKINVKMYLRTFCLFGNYFRPNSQEGTSEDLQNEGSGPDEAKPQRTLPHSEVRITNLFRHVAETNYSGTCNLRPPFMCDLNLEHEAHSLSS